MAPAPKPVGPAMAAAPAPLVLRRLALTDFRSYAGLTLDLDDRPVVLSGPNGAGKTNLLEAVSYLAPGRGLRRARLREVDRDGGGPWAVSAVIEGPLGPTRIGTGRAGDGGRERRQVRIDGENARGVGDLAEHCAVVWLTPEMDRLFDDAASARRSFLDRLVYTADPSHARQLGIYVHSMRERGRVLRGGPADTAWLTALEARMAEAGSAVAAARREVVAGLEGALDLASGRFPRPHLAVAGTVEDRLGESSALETESRFRDALAASRAADADSGGCAVGPHRSDLVVHDAESGLPAARMSTGRKKALLIAIVLAEARLRGARTGSLPLLLLDEIAAHLDEQRRADLFAELIDLGAQAWLTGTDAGIFQPLRRRAQFFRVADSKLGIHEPDSPPD